MTSLLVNGVKYENETISENIVYRMFTIAPSIEIVNAPTDFYSLQEGDWMQLRGGG